MISRVITSKPEELRVFLEEAAGVSKYRERRRETELRLEDTRENLARVGDIRAELDTQLDAPRAAGRGRRALQGAAGAARAQPQPARRSRACARPSRRRTATRNEVQKVTVALEAEMAKLRESERALEELRSRHYQETDHLLGAAGRALRGQRRRAVARAGDRVPRREPPPHGRAARRRSRTEIARSRAAHRRGERRARPLAGRDRARARGHRRARRGCRARPRRAARGRGSGAARPAPR